MVKDVKGLATVGFIRVATMGSLRVIVMVYISLLQLRSTIRATAPSLRPQGFLITS